MADEIKIRPVAYIHTDFKEKFGIPRQSGRVESLLGKLVFENEFKAPEAIRGIEEFSHLWLIFGFSEAKRKSESLTVRPPRLGGNKRVGVFASRSPFRPNSLGLSVVKLLEVAEDGLIVSGVDMLDNTPVYDIKPYLPYADSKPEALGGFGEEFSDYSVNVDFPKELLEKIPKNKREAVISCLKEDPRPSYHEDLRTYSMKFSDFDIHFKVCNDILSVIAVDEKKEKSNENKHKKT